MKKNLDLHFSSSLILRTPAYSYERYQRGELPLDDPYFRTAILVSSKSLYQQLEKIDFDPAKLSAKVRLSLEKYFNRMCFRPTPFGLFSGISHVKWKEGDNAVVFSDQKKLHTLMNFRQSVHLANQLISRVPEAKRQYFANTSIYQVANEFRFLSAENKSNDNREFMINSIIGNVVIKGLLNFCQKPVERADIEQFLVQQFNASTEDSVAYIEELIGQQLILPYPETTITGADYLKKIVNQYQAYDLDGQFLDCVKSVNVIADLEEPKALEQIAAIHSNELLLKEDKPPLYINMEQTVAEGGISVGHQQTILNALEITSKLLPGHTNEVLKNFINAFRDKFDLRAVPLMEALDPETGIAYQALGVSQHLTPLLKDLDIKNSSGTNTKFDWTPTHKMFLNKYIRAEKDENQVIHITDEDIRSLNLAVQPGQTPPSTTVLFRVKDNLIFIEQAGGSTATTVSGRFTPFNSDISDLVKTSAKEEQKNNPAVIFAELVYIAEANISNIDRRETFYDYEIPIMAGSAYDRENQIPLNDLWLGLSGNELILWSKNHQKRVIPRLSSAYNHLRSDLAVFRFLGDLQHQGLTASFTFGLSSFLPTLDYYPRVQYGQAILSLAAWRLKGDDLNAILSVDDPFDRAVTLRQFCSQRRMAQFVTVNEHDHQLLFDLESLSDLQLFSSILQKDKEFFIKEFPFTTVQKAAVKNNLGQGYVNQFLASLYNKNEVYPALRIPLVIRIPKQINRKFMPGSEWVYLKIYCHPSRSNTLLSEHILPIIQKHPEIDSYFFIRYNDPLPHLRVRLHFTPNTKGDVYQHSILKTCFRKFNSLVQQNLINDFSVNTYVRELERYDPSTIAEIESFFEASSALILQNIKCMCVDESDIAYYQPAFCDLDTIAELFDLNIDEREYHFHKMYQHFDREFEADENRSERLKKMYREIKGTGILSETNFQEHRQHPALKKYQEQFKLAIEGVVKKIRKWPRDKKILLMADLNHMHLNRLFVDQSRKQELVVYFCLSNYYHGMRSRIKKEHAVKKQLI